MILILSDEFDFSTTQVLEWLDTYSLKWIRINPNEKIKLKFLGDDILFDLKGNSFLLSEVKGFWYRRGFLNLFNSFLIKSQEVINIQKEELYKIVDFIFYELKNKISINDYNNSDVNKLIVSSMARQFGLKTPKDLIFSEKAFMQDYTKDQPYITKTISGNTVFKIENHQVFNYTSLIDLENIKYSESFFPSFVQNSINKKYELRIFYFNDDFYSMAIFSQLDNKTKVDFRNYNKEKPNRNVPYKLPTIIKSRLTKLMKKLDLDCGSIDMIVNHANEYVFLEVNPIGQFGMVSYPCNFKLEKKIANYFYEKM
jgi:ATP-GRASP peptide maturase of grasp-with-spasm system